MGAWCRILGVVAAMALLTLLSASPAGAQEIDFMGQKGTASINERCLRCHGMATLSYLDPQTRKVVSLAVEPEKYENSNHYRMACTSCHRGEYWELPHVNRTDRDIMTCLGCHNTGKKSKFRTADFDGIGKQFRKSVHYKALPDAFNCFSCHDAHAFEVKADNIDEGVVKSDNAVCLGCHDSRMRFSALTDHAFPSLMQVHDWLPSPNMHWRSVRCIECHTPRGTETGFVNHEIVRGEAVERNCVTCHSKNSTLLSRLYKHRAKEEREVAGLFASMLRNEAYIIGMTRSIEMDVLSGLLVGATLFGISIHAFMRWRITRRRKKG